MSREINVDKVNVNNGLSTNAVSTNDILVDGMSVKDTLKKIPGEYSSFEAFPTNIVIPAGTYDCNLYTMEVLPEPTKANYEKYLNSVIKVGETKYRLTSSDSTYSFVETTDTTVAELFGHNFDTVTGIDYTNAVDATDECGLTFKTYTDKDVNDIIIDWGDGKKTNLKDLTLNVESDGTTLLKYEDVETEDTHDDRKVELKHKYASDKCNQRLIVKVYGLNYTTLRIYATNVPNICSRIFEYNLPISSNLIAVSCICQNNRKLLRVNLTEFYNFKNVVNIFAMFRCTETGKTNLKKVTVSTYNSIYYKNFTDSGEVFNGCTSLIDSQFRLPADAMSYTKFYYNCTNLQSSLNNLLPYAGFKNKFVILTQAFYNCISLTGKITDIVFPGLTFKVSEALWDDTSRKFVSWQTFKNCTSFEDYDSIPTGWK